MFRAFAAIFALLLTALPCAAQEVTGDWNGTYETPARKVPLVLHLRTVDGALAAAVDSPSQGRMAAPASTVIREDSLIRLIVPDTMAFEGRVTPDGQTIEGRWRMGRVIVPIKFSRGVGSTAARRPQTPVAPLPYREEEVAYRNPAAGIRLAATLTLPRGEGPFPAVILVAGSGAQNRDEQSVDGHRPFAVLADHLTRRGIAVLRVDKRGVGFSTGDYEAATLTDFTSDVEAGLAYLRGRPDISRIGLLGHSEGGLIAPLVASRDPKVAFVVMLAGPGVAFADVLPLQSARSSQAAGASPAAIEKRMESDREILKAVLAAPSEAAAFNAARDLFAARAPRATIATLDAQARQITRPWARTLLSYDPAPALRTLQMPVLALNGAKDVQVPPDQSLPAIRKALAGNRDATVVELPGLNHMFQTAGTGGLSEYAAIEESLAPSMLNLVSDWIVQRTGRP